MHQDLGGCTGGPGYQRPLALIKASSEQDYILEQEDYLNNSSSGQITRDEFKQSKKRLQNKESAIRSRMKKKAFYDTLET